MLAKNENITKPPNPPAGVTCQFNDKGESNPKYVDLLDEDKAVAGQKYVCLSFLSPEKILRQRELYFFNQFLKQWDMSKSLEKYQQFLGFISYKYSLTADALAKDFEEFCDAEKSNLFATSLDDDYKTYIDKHEEKLQADFDNNHNFQTNVRGIKVRGSYENIKEAELRCKMLREVDPAHDVYVGQVGIWMPFHPEAYKTQRVEYLEDELNQLMHEKKKNEEKAKREFDKRVREAKEKAMKENEEKALDSGNVLTQTINEDGQLVSVKDNTSTVEKRLDMLGDTVAAADIRKELFEGDNIVLDNKASDHGLGDILKNKNMAPIDENEADAAKADEQADAAKADEQADAAKADEQADAANDADVLDDGNTAKTVII